MNGPVAPPGVHVVPLSPDEVLPRKLPRHWRRIPNPPGQHHLQRTYMHDRVACTVIADLSRRADGHRWLHVSCSMPQRTPTWEEMCLVKEIFIGAERAAVQVHPRASEHYSFHPHCLHLWACLDAEILPDLRAPEGGV